MNTSTRILLLVLSAIVFTSCTAQDAPPPGKKRKLETITSPMGQTMYLYRDVDDR